MGDNFGDGESRERPVHVVDVDAFYIGKFEVTNADWRRFREDPGYTDSKYWPSGRVVPKDQIPYWTQAQNQGVEHRTATIIPSWVSIGTQLRPIATG